MRDQTGSGVLGLWSGSEPDGQVLSGLRRAACAAVRSPEPEVRQSLESKPILYTPPHLVERILAEQAAMEARGATDGERKTITALFADIKGSMALIEDLDPEEARAIVDPALALMMESVHRYEGPQSPTPRRRRKPKRVS